MSSLIYYGLGVRSMKLQEFPPISPTYLSDEIKYLSVNIYFLIVDIHDKSLIMSLHLRFVNRFTFD